MEEMPFTQDHLMVLMMYLNGEHPLCEIIGGIDISGGDLFT
jgi:hypothetical protein